MTRIIGEIGQEVDAADHAAWVDLWNRFGQCLSACAFQHNASAQACTTPSDCLPSSLGVKLACLAGCSQVETSCTAQCSALYRRQLLDLAASMGIDTRVDTKATDAALAALEAQRKQAKAAARAAGDATTVAAAGLGLAAAMAMHHGPKVLDKLPLRFGGSVVPIVGLGSLAAIYGLLSYTCERVAGDPPRFDYGQVTRTRISPMTHNYSSSLAALDHALPDFPLD